MILSGVRKLVGSSLKRMLKKEQIGGENHTWLRCHSIVL